MKIESPFFNFAFHQRWFSLRRCRFARIRRNGNPPRNPTQITPLWVKQIANQNFFAAAEKSFQFIKSHARSLPYSSRLQLTYWKTTYRFDWQITCIVHLAGIGFLSQMRYDRTTVNTFAASVWAREGRRGDVFNHLTSSTKTSAASSIRQMEN